MEGQSTLNVCWKYTGVTLGGAWHSTLFTVLCNIEPAYLQLLLVWHKKPRDISPLRSTNRLAVITEDVYASLSEGAPGAEA